MLLLKKITLLSATLLYASLCNNALAEEEPQKSTIKADKLQTNITDNSISAEGDVQLISGERIFYADELKYYREEGKIEAQGKLKLKDQDSNSILAKEANLKEDASSGEFYNALILFPNGSFIYSPKVVKESPKTSRLVKPKYGVCPSDTTFEQSYDEILDQTLGKRQFLSLTASNVKVDNENEKIIFTNAFPKIYGVPFFYFPYLKTGQPFGKKTTGFEAPRLRKNNNYGYGIFLPYYIKLTETQNMRLTPVFYEEENRILQLEYNNDLNNRNGYLSINADIADDNGASDTIVDNNNVKRIDNGYEEETRGYSEIDGAFELSKDRKWDTHFYGTAVSDKYYLKDYKNNYTSNLKSYSTIERLDNNNIFTFTTLNFRELQDRSSLNIDDSPDAIPILDHNFSTKFYTMNTNATSIYRNDGLQYRRLTLDPGAKIAYKLNGNLFKLSVNTRGDFYDFEGNYENTRRTQFDGEEARFTPQAKLYWENPFVKYNTNSAFIVTPKANFIISKDHNADNNDIANEDSVSSELNDVNLFSDNRYSGYDRIEYGPRGNYGLETSLFHDNIGDFNTFIGQGYRTNDEDNADIRGFRENMSGWVGRVSYKSDNVFDIYYRFLLDRTNFNEYTNETEANFYISRFTLTETYTMFNPEVPGDPKRKQVTSGLTIDITRKWKFLTSITRDLLENQNTSKSAELKYDGYCVQHSLSFKEYRPIDSKEVDRNIDFKFSIKSNLF